MRKVTRGVVLLWFLFAFVSKAQAQNTYICEEYQGYIYEICGSYNICPELVMAIVERESSGKADAKNGSCIGLMQVSERWHKDRMEKLGVTDLYDARGNILVGVDYLSELSTKYNDLPLTLMVYNGSSDAMLRAESGDYTDYAKDVINRSIELEGLHEYD